MQLASLLATILSAAATALLGLIAFRLSRQGQRYAAQRAVGDLQSALARFRAEYPEIMKYTVLWTEETSAILYGRRHSPDSATVVRYYTYIDIGLEFCNTALAARASGSIDPTVFEKHYRPLVRHFLAENYPFVSSSLPGPYLSAYVREELTSAEAQGWDWDLRHERLGGLPARP